jgi:hypothetical protein
MPNMQHAIENAPAEHTTQALNTPVQVNFAVGCRACELVWESDLCKIRGTDPDGLHKGSEPRRRESALAR